MALAGCSTPGDIGTPGFAPSGPGAYDPRLGVRASEKLVPDDKPVPHGGGYNLVGKPYIIAGKRYFPSDKPYRGIGVGSWYGIAFRGRKTANGEIFDTASLSAAHPTMPLPSYARVTNLKNGRSVVVRVNDRGPYHDNRVMDVSERTAEVLDYKHGGISRIKVEYIGRAALAGSNDDKLLATLRTDGNGAVLDRQADEGPVDDARTQPAQGGGARVVDAAAARRRPASRIEARERETIAELAEAPLPRATEAAGIKPRKADLATATRRDEDDAAPTRRKPRVIE